MGSTTSQEAGSPQLFCPLLQVSQLPLRCYCLNFRAQKSYLPSLPSLLSLNKGISWSILLLELPFIIAYLNMLLPYFRGCINGFRIVHKWRPNPDHNNQSPSLSLRQHFLKDISVPSEWFRCCSLFPLLLIPLPHLESFKACLFETLLIR